LYETTAQIGLSTRFPRSRGVRRSVVSISYDESLITYFLEKAAHYPMRFSTAPHSNQPSRSMRTTTHIG
jgi:hypothetical protein